MPMSIKQQDFYAGLLFIIIGVTALIVAQDYQVGTARRMGPGYFPTILGVGLALVGVATCIRGLCGGGEEIDSLAIRPMMFVLLSVVAFGVLLERGGLVLATLVLCALARLGGPRVSWIEVLVLSAALSFVGTVIFVWGLGLPVKVLPV